MVLPDGSAFLADRFPNWANQARGIGRCSAGGGMMTGSVCALRAVELDVSHLEASEKFFTEIWGLSLAGRDGDAVYLRGTDKFHHIRGHLE